MNAPDNGPSISREKARRLKVGRPRRLGYLVLLIVVAFMVAVGGAYAFVSRTGQGSNTSTIEHATSSTYAVTVVDFACNPSPQFAGTSADCTAKVANSQAGAGVSPPTGTVTFAGGTAGSLGTPSCLTSASGLVCTIGYAAPLGTEGPHPLEARYSGDPLHMASSSNFTLVVSGRPTTTGVSCSPGTIPVNVNTICTARVLDVGSGTASTPTGTVSFGQSSSWVLSSPSCTLSGGSCTVTVFPKPGSEGRISLPVSYSGDRDHLQSSGPGTDSLMVTKRAASASVSCVPSSVLAGTLVTCTATVEDATSVGLAVLPTGNFTFSTPVVGASFTPPSCALVYLSSASSSCSTHYIPTQGSQSSQKIGGTYGGDKNHFPAPALPFDLQIKARGSSTSVSCGTSSVPVASAVSCTAVVSDLGSGGKVQPTGKVTFTSSGQGTFGSSVCYLGSGSSCAVTYTPAAGSEGSATITATYSGDAIHSASSISIILEIVPRVSSVSISCNPSFDPVNAPTTCVANVSDVTGGGSGLTPTGMVTFSASGGTFDSGDTCVLSGGSCSVTFTPSLGSEGPISMGASYPGDTDHFSSSAQPITITATVRAVSVSVTCSPTSIGVPGGSTTCTVIVTDTDGGSPTGPTGTVSFSSDVGSFSSASCTLASGSCSVTWTAPISLTSATATITATYTGDTDHAGGSDSTTVSY